MIGEAQIGTAHIDEIDASKANLINVTAKNVATDGLTANIIKGGKLSSLNGVTDFDLQTGWIDMNGDVVGIRNRFGNKPLQYLVFGEGSINTKPGSYTALMSNSNGRVNMDDGSAGIQIWNTNDNTTAVNLYGDNITLMYNADDKKGINFDNVTNNVTGLNVIETGSIILTGYKNYNIKSLLDDIYRNIKQLHQVKETKIPYKWSTFGPI